MSKVALLTVHGMGETDVGYASDLFDRLARRIGARWIDVSTHSVYYQDILQGNEAEVWRRIDDQAKVRYDNLRKFLLFGFADAAGLENGKEQPDSVYVDAQVEIASMLYDACRQLGGSGPVVVISQSLGCQVFSSYLYDAQKSASGHSASVGIWRDIDEYAARITQSDQPLSADEKAFLQGGTVQAWITTGCNIPMFVAAHKQMSIKPIDPPTPNFKWLNLYDPDDILGWPLRPLGNGYETLVEDRAMDAGEGAVEWILKSWNPMSHTAYWSDKDVLNPLAQMLVQFLA
jgi:hypothetical protein